MRCFVFKTVFTAVVILASLAAVASAQEKLDRTVLPIQEPERPTYCELDVRNVAASNALPAGPTTVKLDFVYDGGGLGKGGTATLSVDGNTVAEGIGIGPVETGFTGKIDQVTVEVKEVK